MHFRLCVAEVNRVLRVIDNLNTKDCYEILANSRFCRLISTGIRAVWGTIQKSLHSGEIITYMDENPNINGHYVVDLGGKDLPTATKRINPVSQDFWAHLGTFSNLFNS